MHYTWKKPLLALAKQVFDDKPKKRDVEPEQRKRDVTPLQEVLAEITAENVGPKRTLSGLEDHGKTPAKSQQRMHEEVKRAKQRTGCPTGRRWLPWE